MPGVVWLRGENGAVLSMSAPLPAAFASRVARGVLQVIDAPQAVMPPDREPGKPPAPPAPPGIPNRGASRADWADYAVSQGMDPAQVEGMTRNQLANATGSLRAVS